jgi:hypothetical protein
MLYYSTWTVVVAVPPSLTVPGLEKREPTGAGEVTAMEI